MLLLPRLPIARRKTQQEARLHLLQVTQLIHQVHLLRMLQVIIQVYFLRVVQPIHQLEDRPNHLLLLIP